MASGKITDKQISASTVYPDHSAASRGRLHIQQSANIAEAWLPTKQDAKQWLQVDLGDQFTTVTRIATQRRNGAQYGRWVTKYQLQYSNDEGNFQYYKEQGKTTDRVSPIHEEVDESSVDSIVGSINILDVIFSRVYEVISSLICIFCTFCKP